MLEWQGFPGHPNPDPGMDRSTRVATPQGWRQISDLTTGEAVLTVDSGARQIRAIRQTPPSSPIVIPAHALENAEPVILLPGQFILIEADLAEFLYGDPLALLPAAALTGWRGISPSFVQTQPLTLCFDTAEVIYAGRAVLLPCAGLDGTPITDPPPYTMQQARHLVACLMAEDLGGALRAARSPHAAV